MNQAMAFYLTLAILIIILVYAGGVWRSIGLVLSGILLIWTIVKLIRQNTGSG